MCYAQIVLHEGISAMFNAQILLHEGISAVFNAQIVLHLIGGLISKAR